MFLNSCVKQILSLFNTNVHTCENICKLTYKQCKIRRTFFGSASDTPKTKIYRDKKIVGFSAEQMYSVVSDVGNYKHFVPFCKKSTLLIQKPEYMQAHLVIGFPPIVENYTSNITLKEPYFVKSICIEGKLFDHLETTWKFSPALKSNPQSCITDFYVSFEFRSLLHSQLANLFFDKMVSQMEVAFINEARVRYGKESLPSRSLGSVQQR